MYKNNRIYGNGPTLNRYSGRRDEAPIWGEVQHSVKFNLDHLQTLNSPRLVKSFFTWRKQDAEVSNRFFREKWKFKAIGDPFIYQVVSSESQKFLNLKTKILIVPKFERGKEERKVLEEHFALARKFGNSNSGVTEVSLHPGERYNPRVKEIYVSKGIVVSESPYYYDTNYLYSELAYLSTFAEIHTNYIGPTLLRGVYLGAKGIAFEAEGKGIFDSKMQKVFNTKSSMSRDQQYAEELLGAENVLYPGELADLLDGPFGQVCNRVLQKGKFLLETNLKNMILAKNIPNIDILCTNCIQKSKAMQYKEHIICGACGHKLRSSEDFYCLMCKSFGKIIDCHHHIKECQN
jgi:hypothetical protein